MEDRELWVDGSSVMILEEMEAQTCWKGFTRLVKLVESAVAESAQSLHHAEQMCSFQRGTWNFVVPLMVAYHRGFSVRRMAIVSPLEFTNLAEIPNAMVQIPQTVRFGCGTICHSHDAFPQWLELPGKANRVSVPLQAHNGFRPDIENVSLFQLLSNRNPILQYLERFELCIEDLALELFVDDGDGRLVRRNDPQVALRQRGHQFPIFLSPFFAARSAFLRFLCEPKRSEAHRRADARHQKRDLTTVHSRGFTNPVRDG